jgi:NADH-quinone oxidoreductase subunit A
MPRRREECVPPVEPFDLSTYYPIFLYLLGVLGFAGVSLLAAHKIGPRKDTRVKLMPYESGMDPIGDAHQRFDVKFYLVAIMFLVFDVELLFLYPWAVIAYSDQLGLPAELSFPIFWSVLVFLGLLLLAYVYDWRKAVFRWR